MSTCQECGKPMPASRGPRERKWCSDRCRKRQYSRPCVECGKLTYGGNGGGAHQPKRCSMCAPRSPKSVAYRAGLHAGAAARDAIIVRMWAEGAQLPEIATALDTSKGAIGVRMRRLRVLGVDIPYRHTMVGGKRVPA